jgi:hypothetical protein
MSISRATELATQGDLLGAEDLLWKEIDAGNIEAKLQLAFCFHDAELYSLAKGHYQDLAGTQFWNDAASQLGSIYLDVHDYRGARESLAGVDTSESQSALAAISSVEEKSAGYVDDIPKIVENLLENETMLLSKLAKSPAIDDQLALLDVREFLAHYASVLRNDLARAASATTVNVQIVPGSVVSRAAGIAVGEPARRWFEAAHTAANTVALATQDFPQDRGLFESLTLRGFSAIEKKYVLNGRRITETDEDFAVNNIAWALAQLGHPAKDFWSSLLDGD